MATKFQEIEKLILNNKTQKYTAAWEKFCQINPWAIGCQTEEQLFNEAEKYHVDINPTLLIALEIRQYQPVVRPPKQPSQEQTDQPAKQTDSNLPNLSSAIFTPLAFLNKGPQRLEDDDEYLKIEAQIKQKWLEERKKAKIAKKEKDKGLTEEDLDYLYGSIDGKETPTLKEQAEAEFRKKAAEETAKTQEKARKKSVSEEKIAKIKGKLEKKLAKYDEIKNKPPKSPRKDIEIQEMNERILQHAAERVQAKRLKGEKVNLKQMSEEVRKREMESLVKKGPQKVEAYLNITNKGFISINKEFLDQLKEAKQRVEEQKRLKEEEEKTRLEQERIEKKNKEAEEKTQVKEDVQEELNKYQSQTATDTKQGVEIKYVEKSYPAQSETSLEQKTATSVQQTKIDAPRQVNVIKKRNAPINKEQRTSIRRIFTPPSQTKRQAPLKIPRRFFPPIKIGLRPTNEFSRKRPSNIVDFSNNALGSLTNTLGLGNKAGNFLTSQMTRLGAQAAVATAGFSVGLFVFVFAAIAIIFLLGLFIKPFPGIPSSPIPTIPPYDDIGGGGGDITNCKFYRGGDPTKWLNFPKDSKMPLKITEISSKVGVPSAIIAGIMRVESPSAIVRTDPTYLEKDYDATYSGAGAVGVMQFMAPTFMGIYNAYQNDLKDKFNKTSYKMTIDPPSNMEPEDVFRIYSIRDSITAAAYKVKADKNSINGDGPWDETTVKKIAARYYGTNKDGTTNYPGHDGSIQNYGEDLWKSFSNCAPSTPLPTICPLQEGSTISNFSDCTPSTAAVSCPLKGGSKVIGCGSFMSDPKYNRYSCAGPLATDRGHCGKNYPSSCSYKGNIETTKNTRRAHAVDVDGPAGEIVYLPTIDGKTVEWHYKASASYPIAPGDGGGYGHVFTSNVNGDNWELHLIHTKPPPLSPPPMGRRIYMSGDIVTWIAATGYTHLHINIAKNPERSNGGNGWLNPEDLGMCTQ